MIWREPKNPKDEICARRGRGNEKNMKRNTKIVMKMRWCCTEMQWWRWYLISTNKTLFNDLLFFNKIIQLNHFFPFLRLHLYHHLLRLLLCNEPSDAAWLELPDYLAGGWYVDMMMMMMVFILILLCFCPQNGLILKMRWDADDELQIHSWCTELLKASSLVRQ